MMAFEIAEEEAEKMLSKVVNSEEKEDAGVERGKERLEKKETSALSVKDLVEKQESTTYSAKKKKSERWWFLLVVEEVNNNNNNKY